MQFSYWEQSTYFDQADVTIIGSGIVGLSTAISLKELHPNLKIIVLERGLIPTGASTKNAGFACIGSITEILDDLNVLSDQEVQALVNRRYQGLQKLRHRVTDQILDYQPLGGYELIADQTTHELCEHNLDRLNTLLTPITNLAETFTDASNKLPQFCFQNTHSLFLNHAEGQINTGQMMQALIQIAASKGIKILNQITVTHFDEATVHTDQTPPISTKRLIICTNGFARQLLPDLDVNPARAQVLITKPIPNLPFQGTFHLDRGYYYFRNIHNRVLFGGGRNLDFECETTTDMQTTTLIQNQLKTLLQTTILPKTPHEIDYAWAGIMGMGTTKKPIIQQINPTTFCAVRMGGMGVAIGTLVGEETAQMVSQSL
ncbi:FAD-dependent oxidoreductase [Armatimonadetes bacterium Uphvl-Ar1]|nr:FAD-dependent oxidoreductase [Armatimonadetes bacterium Uphvl-Ar1]